MRNFAHGASSEVDVAPKRHKYVLLSIVPLKSTHTVVAFGLSKWIKAGFIYGNLTKRNYQSMKYQEILCENTTKF